MPLNDEERQSALGEPAEDMGMTDIPEVLTRVRHGRRKTPVRPSEKRRRSRKVGVTFTTEEIPDRIRELAKRWNVLAPDGESPAVSTVIEYLMMPRLEAAEDGEIDPPPRGWRARRRE